jgi:ketosteroid isomerase-like protein
MIDDLFKLVSREFLTINDCFDLIIYSSIMALTREKLLQLGKNLVAGYNAWDIDSILSIRTPDCVWHILPGSRARSFRNNEEYRKFFSTMIPAFKNFTLSLIDEDTAIDVENRLITLHLKSTADSVIGPYANEYFVLLKSSPDGSLIEVGKEFVDSAYSSEFFPKLQEYFAAQNKG